MPFARKHRVEFIVGLGSVALFLVLVVGWYS